MRGPPTWEGLVQNNAMKFHGTPFGAASEASERASQSSVGGPEATCGSLVAHASNAQAPHAPLDS